jgi:hypothetical protein
MKGKEWVRELGIVTEKSRGRKKGGIKAWNQIVKGVSRVTKRGNSLIILKMHFSWSMSAEYLVLSDA